MMNQHQPGVHRCDSQHRALGVGKRSFFHDGQHDIVTPWASQASLWRLGVRLAPKDTDMHSYQLEDQAQASVPNTG